MELFGVGPLELVLIIILVLIVFGPRDLEKTGRTIGQWLYKLVRSDSWRTMQQTGRELKNLPNRLMREAGMEDMQHSIKGDLGKADGELKQNLKDEGKG
jgi:sec-independent protein translocase protein TatB